jgi:hypothetical protein
MVKRVNSSRRLFDFTEHANGGAPLRLTSCKRTRVLPVIATSLVRRVLGCGSLIGSFVRSSRCSGLVGDGPVVGLGRTFGNVDHVRDPVLEVGAAGRVRARPGPGDSILAIAAIIGRSPSTVSRDCRPQPKEQRPFRSQRRRPRLSRGRTQRPTTQTPTLQQTDRNRSDPTVALTARIRRPACGPSHRRT